MVKTSKVTTAMLSKKRRTLLWSVLALVILTGLIILYGSSIKRTEISASSNAEYAKATVTKILEDYSGGQPYQGKPVGGGGNYLGQP